MYIVTHINIQTIQSSSYFIFLTWYQSHSSDFLVPVDISGVLPLPSPSSSNHCQKRVTAVMPTVPATLGSRHSAHPTVKAKVLSDRIDNPEQNPTKNGQKTSHTRPHALPEFSASRTRATRAATSLHAPSLSLTRHTRQTSRPPRALTHLHAPHAPTLLHGLPHQP